MKSLLLFLVISVFAVLIPTKTDAQQHVFFDDEFNAPALDTGTWYAFDQMDTWGWADCLHPGNVSVSSGSLTITSRKESIPCVNGSTPTYTSGAASLRNYAFTYGTVEVRAKMLGTGTWPAIWLLGSDCQPTAVSLGLGYCTTWPLPGSDEIDIAEIMWSSPTVVNQAIHSNYTNPYCLTPVTDASKNWHLYQLTWKPNFIEWRIDDEVTCTQAVNVPTTPMFLILDSFMGASGGPIANSALPQSMQVDFVRITPAGIAGNP